MEKNSLIFNGNEQIRVDTFISLNSNITRSHVKKLCENGCVFVNGVLVKPNKMLKENDLVEFIIPQVETCRLQPQNIDLDIIYQDNDLAVINKPQGMVVHEGNGTNGNTLVNALLFHLDSLSGINGVIRPGIVHRIDKNTSGLLVVAKNDISHLSLSKQLENKTCKRIYTALLEGVVKNDAGVIDTFIARNEKDRTKMAVSSHGRQAITEYKVIKRYNQYTLCEFSLKTGRTHQIRVHAKHIGHPIVGDPEYGYKNQKFKLNGQLLHAGKLEFVHPTLNKVMTFSCDLPNYFKNILTKLKGE